MLNVLAEDLPEDDVERVERLSYAVRMIGEPYLLHKCLGRPRTGNHQCLFEIQAGS